MPTTYGRPRTALNANTSISTYPSSNPISNFGSNSKDNPETDATSRSPSPDFVQDWKQKLKDIDNDEYDGEMVQAPASSSLTPLVSSSSLSAAPDTQPAALPRSSPPASPTYAYRDRAQSTDDPDTSLELNTTVTAPSSDPEDQPLVGHADDKNDDSEDEPVIGRRMSKPLRVLESDSDEGNVGLRKPTGRRRFHVQSTSSPTSSGNNFSQLSPNQPAVRSSSATTPASNVRKSLKLALTLSDDSDNDRAGPVGDEDSGDQIEDAKESPKQTRLTRKKGLNKSEKSEMAKAQQAIVASRTIRMPDTSKRRDPNELFKNYSASAPQAEIDSYPFPPGGRPHKPHSQKPTFGPKIDGKAAMRQKIGGLPRFSLAAPKFEPPTRPSAHQSDPIVGSSQSQGLPTLGSEAKSEEEEDLGGIGQPNALGALMFGASKSKGQPSGGDVFGPNAESDDDLPAASSLVARPKQSVGESDKKRALAEKKRAALAAQEASRRLVSDSESDVELEIASQGNKNKAKAESRILVRPGQEPQNSRTHARDDVTETQVERAGHAVHFGRDAAQIGSSPVRGGGVYEESQFGRVPLSGAASSRTIRPRPTPRKSTGKPNNVTLTQLTRHVAMRAQADGQARQKADEERWKANGGREKVAREGVLKVEDAVRQALRGERDGDDNQAEEDGEDDDEEDDDYRGSASESEEDKENLPASGRARRPHEPVSDFDGSGMDEEADADKENSLELAGMNARSPAPSGAQSPARSPVQSPRQPGQGLSPALSPSGPPGRSPSQLRPHLRVPSSASRSPLSQLEDEHMSAGGTGNAAVTRAPLGELDVELEAEVEDDEEEIPRRPKKRAKSGLGRLFDEDEGVDKSPSKRLISPSQRRFGSPSQRLGSPTPRTQLKTARFLSPPSRLRSPLPASGTQNFSQVETQAMLGGLGDVFGFESQAPAPGNKDVEAKESDGGLTQLFANAGATTSSAFAALRADANNVELTQDERSKLLYRPVLGDDELRRDQELFEREDEIMAQPFSPTQRENGTQQWLNERGLWTQTRPPQAHSNSFTSTPLSPTQKGTSSPLPSPPEGEAGRRRIVRRGPIEPEIAPIPKLPSVLDRLMNGAQAAAAKEKKKKKADKSEFILGEAAESDDEYGDFGPRAREEDEGEGEEGEEQHVEGLVDDVAMDEETANAANVQAKYLEQNAEDDARNEKVAREVVAGKYRNRRRGRGDNMDLDDDESDDDGYTGPKKLLKKRKIENDGLDGLEKHESTRPFVEMYNKGIKSAGDNDFDHLNQIVDDPFGGAPEPDSDEDEENGQEGVQEDEEEDGQDDQEEATETVTPFKAAQKYIPSSVGAEVAYGLDDSDEEPTINLPDAAPRSLGSAARGAVSSNVRLTSWAAQESGNVRIGLHGGQGASVTGYNKNKTMKSKTSSFSRPAVPSNSSSSSNRLSRLGSKANGFA